MAKWGIRELLKKTEAFCIPTKFWQGHNYFFCVSVNNLVFHRILDFKRG